jgi:hypothetical protein
VRCNNFKEELWVRGVGRKSEVEVVGEGVRVKRSGTCGCGFQGMRRCLVYRMLAAEVHCNENPIYVFPVSISTFMCL